MRTLKLQVQMSIDGFIATTDSKMDWMVWDWDDSAKRYVTELHTTVDCIVLGKTFAQGFIPYWAEIAAKPEDPQYTFARKMTDVQKVIFSTTIDPAEQAPKEYPNSQMANTTLQEGVLKLKNQSGGDIIAYGGGAFVSSLIKAGLVDEFHLLVNPAILGKGMAIFHTIESRQNLTLKHALAFDCGIVVLKYVRKQA